MHFNLCSVDGCSCVHCAFWCSTQVAISGAKRRAGCYTQGAFPGTKRWAECFTLWWAFANVPFLIFGVTFARTRLHLERRLCSFLGLPNITTELADANAHPLKVFVAKELRKDQYLDGPPEYFLAKASCKDQYLDGFKWLSQYIKW